MPDWTLVRGGNRAATLGANAAASNGASFPVGSANVKQDWVELSASTPFRGHALTFNAGGTSKRSMLVDIAVGAAGSEQVIVENLLITTTDKQIVSITLPLLIPAGVRLATRQQNNAGTITVRDVTAILHGPALLVDPGPNRATTYGADTSDSGGVQVDPGDVAHTKGAWSEIVASTTNPIKQVLVIFGTQGNGTMTGGSWLFDIGIGAAGSEQIILADLLAQTNAQEQLSPPCYGPFAVNIPAGTRLAARAQSEVIDAIDRLLDVVILGLD